MILQPSVEALRAARAICTAENTLNRCFSLGELAFLIDRETGIRDLLDAAPRIVHDEDGSVWMHVENAAINLSVRHGPVIKKALLAWAEKLSKQQAERQPLTRLDEGGEEKVNG